MRSFLFRSSKSFQNQGRCSQYPKEILARLQAICPSGCIRCSDSGSFEHHHSLTSQASQIGWTGSLSHHLNFNTAQLGSKTGVITPVLE